MRHLFLMILACQLCGLVSLAQPRRVAPRPAPKPTAPARASAAAPVLTMMPDLNNPTDPFRARFDYRDIARFWQAFDAWQAGARGNPFDSLYWRGATPQTRLLLAKNGLANADSLRAVVGRRRADYLRCRPITERMAETEASCRAVYLALKALYPAAVFPAANFGIGAFLVGGNYQPKVGLVVGAEMHELATIRVLTGHELVHAQQQVAYKYRIILEQCLVEGGADFVCELITGYVATPAPHAWARGREREIWREFERDQNFGEKDNWGPWLYGGERAPGRPADVGYYVGYQICKAYYERATDKRQAIYDILHLVDARDFLRRSHYADQFR